MKRNIGISVATLVVVAACSSSGNTALSKDDFLKRANQICKDGNDAIAAAKKNAFPDSEKPGPEAFKKFFDDTILPNGKKEIDDIAALKPPQELEGVVTKLMSDVRAKLAQVQDEVDKGPSSVLNSSVDPFTNENHEANDIGLTACGGRRTAVRRRGCPERRSTSTTSARPTLLTSPSGGRCR